MLRILPTLLLRETGRQQQSQDIKTLSWTWVTTFQEEVSLKYRVTFSTSFVLIKKVSMSTYVDIRTPSL